MKIKENDYFIRSRKNQERKKRWMKTKKATLFLKNSINLFSTFRRIYQLFYKIEKNQERKKGG